MWSCPKNQATGKSSVRELLYTQTRPLTPPSTPRPSRAHVREVKLEVVSESPAVFQESQITKRSMSIKI